MNVWVKVLIALQLIALCSSTGFSCNNSQIGLNCAPRCLFYKNGGRSWDYHETQQPVVKPLYSMVLARPLSVIQSLFNYAVSDKLID